MTTVMLVHGAWHRPNTWEKLETKLHALGYGTHAVGAENSAGPVTWYSVSHADPAA
jgi:hypothetical protein